LKSSSGGPLDKDAPPVKYNAGKPPLSWIPRPALRWFAQALKFGGDKYSKHNYIKGEGLPYSWLLDAALRHLTDFQDGEDFDPESNLHHLAHAGATIAMLIHLISEGKGVDDRIEFIRVQREQEPGF
jgi:hypothetical protein